MIGANNMSTSEAQKRAVAKYQDEKTDLIKFRVEKGKKAEYQALAKKILRWLALEYLREKKQNIKP